MIYNLNLINQWFNWVLKWRSDLETAINIPGMFQTSNKGYFPIPNDSVQTESNLFGSVAMLLISNNFNDNQLTNNCLIIIFGKEKKHRRWFNKFKFFKGINNSNTVIKQKNNKHDNNKILKILIRYLWSIEYTIRLYCVSYMVNFNTSTPVVDWG